MICDACKNGNHEFCIDTNAPFQDALEMLEPMCDCKICEENEK